MRTFELNRLNIRRLRDLVQGISCFLCVLIAKCKFDRLRIITFLKTLKNQNKSITKNLKLKKMNETFFYYHLNFKFGS